MTYAERIESIAKAIWRDCDGSSFGWDEVDQDQYRAYAVAADRACLAAIEEPTERMIVDGMDVEEWAKEVWRAMHKAIPRGEI